MLCTTRVMTVLGKAPEMSRKRPDTTRPFLHFLNVQCIASMSKSVVDLPGLPPKCVGGRRLWVSVRWTRSLDTIEDNILAMVLRRVIGR